MEDFRLFYAKKTMDSDGGMDLPDNIKKQIGREPVPSVRPQIPSDMQYVGTVYREKGICFDYYQLPDGSFRQEYRRRYQEIILEYNPDGNKGKERRKVSMNDGAEEDKGGNFEMIPA